MKKCANCGYVRRPEDDEYAMVPSKACPKCYAFYPGEQTGQTLPDSQIKPDARIKPDTRITVEITTPPRPGMSRAMWLSILVVAVAISFSAAYFLTGNTRDAPSTSVSQAPVKLLPGGESPAEGKIHPFTAQYAQ